MFVIFQRHLLVTKNKSGKQSVYDGAEKTVKISNYYIKHVVLEV